MIALLAPVIQAQAQLVPPGDLSSPFNTQRVLFFIFALLVVGGAIATIVQRNNVGAVMSLVATFFGLAAIYTFLSAHFLAALQVLVYAGAIMVLFIFVVMVLNRDETDPWVWRGWLGKVIVGVVPVGYFTLRLFTYLRGIGSARPGVPSEEFGTIAQIGELLFTDYLFAFEAVSVLLLIAVIAAVVVARTHKHVEHAHAPEPAPDHRYGDAQSGLPYHEPASSHGGGHH